MPLHQHYKIFRDYAEYEERLINNRLLWNINIQGFLFATYGFSLQKLAEVQARPLAQEIIGAKSMYWLIGVLPFFGITISVFSWIGVYAAQKAIMNLNAQWLALTDNRTDKKDSAGHPLLPFLIGGGIPSEGESHPLRANRWGALAPRLFPWIFCSGLDSFTRKLFPLLIVALMRLNGCCGLLWTLSTHYCGLPAMPYTDIGVEETDCYYRKSDGCGSGQDEATQFTPNHSVKFHCHHFSPLFRCTNITFRILCRLYPVFLKIKSTLYKTVTHKCTGNGRF